MIASACQKLIAMFHQRPEQKIVFITQHGLLPLMELLEVPKTRVWLLGKVFVLFIYLFFFYLHCEHCFE